MKRLSAPALVLLGACNGNETNVNTLVPELVVLPETVDFGEVVGGETSSLAVEITNTGRADLELSALSFQQGATSSFSADLFAGAEDGAEVVVVEPNDKYPLTITFSPVEWTTYADAMLIDWNSETLSPTEVPLTGTGVDIDRPDIASDPADCLDFGDVEPGDSKSMVLTILNEGEDALEVADTQIVGSGAFTVAPDLDGQTGSPGGSLATIVTYAPTSSAGDSATYTITSNDPDEPDFEVCFLGNGGGSADYPVAVIDCPGDSAPMETLSFDGSGSYDPAGDTSLTYAWTLSRQPDGSETALDSDGAATTSLYLDVAGDYTVSLVVTNSAGVPSAPAECDVAAIPTEDIRIELSWDKDGTDMDLHLAQDTAALFDVPGDVSFCNDAPDWGEVGLTDDDPDYSQKDDDGLGPEAIEIVSPTNGDYHVRVHYYEDENEGSSVATVRFYVYGSLAEEVSYTLSRNEVWDVGYIRWPYGYVVLVDEEPAAAERRNCPSE